MRLNRIQEHLTAHNVPFQYYEEDDCGSITFVHKGLSYHIWEYPAPERGAQSNIRSAGKSTIKILLNSCMDSVYSAKIGKSTIVSPWFSAYSTVYRVPPEVPSKAAISNDAWSTI